MQRALLIIGIGCSFICPGPVTHEIERLVTGRVPVLNLMLHALASCCESAVDRRNTAWTFPGPAVHPASAPHPAAYTGNSLDWVSNQKFLPVRSRFGQTTERIGEAVAWTVHQS